MVWESLAAKTGEKGKKVEEDKEEEMENLSRQLLEAVVDYLSEDLHLM